MQLNDLRSRAYESIQHVNMKALFLDRDGIINKRIVGGYVRTPNEFEFLEDIFPLMQLAKSCGYLLIMISNQQGVGKGLMTQHELDLLHTFMQDALQKRLGFALDALYVCTDLDGTDSPRRKPQPGMLMEAFTHHSINPATSWFIGDSKTDAQAGRAAGVHTILVGEFSPTDATIVVPDLAAAHENLAHLL